MIMITIIEYYYQCTVANVPLPEVSQYGSI